MSAYPIESYRQLFPYLSTGTKYFNHAAVSPFSTRVLEAIQQYLEMKGRTNIEPFEEVMATVASLKGRIARLLNCSPARIALLDNTSNGLNIVANGLRWRTGDRVLLTDMEFPANVYPFMNLKRLGVEVDFVPNRNGKILVEDVEKALTPRTRLFSISHVQFLHGFRADLAALGEVCHRRDVVFSVDAIQSAGTTPIDVDVMKIDFLAAGGQKWLMGPEGIAFVYVSEPLQAKVGQAYMGWMNIKNFVSDFFRYRMDLEDDARRYENGTPNFAGIYGLHASLGLLLEAGIPQIASHLADLTRFTTDRVRERGGELVSPLAAAERGGIVTFRPPDAKAMFEKLNANKIHVSIREDCIRFSPHFYNTRQELEEALAIALA